MKPLLPSKISHPPFFSPEAIQFFDERLPNWIKAKYGKNPSTVRPLQFNQKDVIFFSKGLKELSELFTTERGSSLPNYFSHPRFRSSYFLYFLPLQTAKFLLLYRKHQAALLQLMENPHTPGEFHVWDLGAGPGTASLALLLFWKDWETVSKKPRPRLIFHWVDAHLGIMKEGTEILRLLEPGSEKDPHSAVNIEWITGDWKRITPKKADLFLLGNVWNEAPLRKHSAKRNSDDQNGVSPEWLRLKSWLTELQASLLFLEPAQRLPSQTLSHLRDWMISEDDPIAIVGPCLHQGKCPLSEGRDWCHFSERTVQPANPAKSSSTPLIQKKQSVLPLKWFTELSKMLGSEREWLKFSYLWLTFQGLTSQGLSFRGPNSGATPQPSQQERLVVSDPIKSHHKKEAVILLCEPNHVRRITLSTEGPLPQRGSLFKPQPKVGRD